MATKLPSLELFLHPSDERALSARIRATHPEVVFFSTESFQHSAAPAVQSCITACAGPIVIVLHQRLLPLATYIATRVIPHPSGIGFLSGKVGRGLMLMQRCQTPAFDPQGLFVGSITANYESDDAEMAQFVTSTLKLIKTDGKKVFFIDPRNGQPVAHAQPGYWAWPDAARSYDGRNGRFLRPDAVNRMVAP